MKIVVYGQDGWKWDITQPDFQPSIDLRETHTDKFGARERRYAFSSYKCWGPHAAVLYGSHAAFAALGERGAGPNHFWIKAEQPVYKVRAACCGGSHGSKARNSRNGLYNGGSYIY